MKARAINPVDLLLARKSPPAGPRRAHRPGPATRSFERRRPLSWRLLPTFVPPRRKPLPLELRPARSALSVGLDRRDPARPLRRSSPTVRSLGPDWPWLAPSLRKLSSRSPRSAGLRRRSPTTRYSCEVRYAYYAPSQDPVSTVASEWCRHPQAGFESVCANSRRPKLSQPSCASAHPSHRGC